MMNEGPNSKGAPFPDSPNSSAAYLQRAASAVESGDDILGIHLYLAAYERALQEHLVPSDEAIAGMDAAWKLAVDTKQRSLAEYIFEKLEPFWGPEEVARHADELQRLAFDKLEEYGFDRDAIEDMADMVNQDLLGAMPDILCRFEGHDDEEDVPRDEKGNPLHTGVKIDPAELAGTLPLHGKKAATQPDAPEPPSAAAAEAMPTTAAFAAAQMKPPAEATASLERMDYRSLVGFDGAIATMADLGVGRSRDPEFARFIEMLNQRHGTPAMPGLGTLVFTSPAREDANYFMVATVGELDLPAVRLRLDHNAQGQAVLCVMASPDFKSRLSGVPAAGFDSPTAVILEDLDLWDLPLLDVGGDMPGLFQVQLSRGAREALALIQTALSSPDATVLISAAEPADIDPFFWDLMGPHRTVDIELPDAEERREVWRAAQAQHPSLRGLDVNQLVAFSRTLSRFEIFAVANEAVEAAYRASVAAHEFRAVPTDDMLVRLASFQPLDSLEYRQMEDLVVERFRKGTSDFDGLLGN